MSRREFTRNQREQIVDRAKNEAGQICCEMCGLVLAGKPYEIDHVIAEALRPEADKKAPITIAEGQLLGKECCHRSEDGKTARDVKAIAKSKRQNAKHLGIAAPKQTIVGKGFPKSPKSHNRVPKPEFNLPRRQLYREV